MSTQKEITITQLKGKFTKDFDTFNKMDTFLTFCTGKCGAKTEVANQMGKEPVWKNTIKLIYFDQGTVHIEAFDEDVTSNEFIGVGKIDLKSLKASGNLQIPIITKDGENVGTVSGKYVVKNLPVTPLLLIKSSKVQLFKEVSYFIKAKPCLNISCKENNITTQQKQNGKGILFTWTDAHIRLRIAENSRILFCLIDKNENATIVKFLAQSKEFKLENGNKKYNLLSEGNCIGTLELDFETVGFVSKEEHARNVQKFKKAENEVCLISIENIKPSLKIDSNNLDLKAAIGKSSSCTKIKDGKLDLLAESKQNKVFLFVKEEDKIKGSGSIDLENFNGQKTVQIENQDKEDIGTITFTATSKQANAKSITFSNICAEFSEDTSADLIGSPQPFVKAQIGGCSGRTQTGSGNKFTFKKNIQLKYVDEPTIVWGLYDEDVLSDEKLYEEKLNLSELKGNKGQAAAQLLYQDGDKTINRGKISFKYEIKVNKPQSPVKKQSEKKIQNTSKVEPTKVETKVQNTTKQESNSNHEPKNNQNDQETKTQREQKQSINSNSRQVQSNRNKDTKSLDKSRGTVNLPSIMQGHKFGDRIFDVQSSATLQKSIVVFSMPKAPRFANGPKYSGQPSYCVDSVFKSSNMKGAGFGFGNKRQFPEWMQKNMKENPPPGSYFDSKTQYRPKGPTFGIGYKHYEKVTIPKDQIKAPINKRLAPIMERKK